MANKPDLIPRDHGLMTAPVLAAQDWLGHKPAMAELPSYGVQIRQYPRASGVTWRWWVFDRRGGTHLDTGVIVGLDRGAAEQAATNAITRLELRERPPGHSATNAPRTIRL